MDQIILSILTPAVPRRMLQLAELCEDLEAQIGSLPVEHLVMMDNKRRTVGAKRDALLRAAKGRYVAFVDDDDLVEPCYIAKLLEASQSNPDVITFRQRVEYNRALGEVEFKLGNPNEPFEPGKITRRNAWHVCAWKHSWAMLSHFPNSNYGEDWEYAARLCSIDGLIEVHIPEILHNYIYDARTSEAPPPTLTR